MTAKFLRPGALPQGSTLRCMWSTAISDATSRKRPPTFWNTRARGGWIRVRTRSTQLGEWHFHFRGGAMHRIDWKFFSLLLVVSSVLSLAPTTKAAEQPTVSEVLKGNLDYVQNSVVPATEAMPADKFSFAPTNGEFKGVRTYAQLIKHIAVWNYRFGASILEEKPPVDTGGADENGPDTLNSKAEVTKYLADSFAYLQKAIATRSEERV